MTTAINPEIIPYPDFIILVAEILKGQEAEFDVYEFSSLEKLKVFRTTFPEKMKCEYSYALSAGTRKDGSHVQIASAAHFKQFSRLVKATGIEI